MSEIVNDRTIFSLLEVTKSIQKTLSERYKSAFWVKAEMNKLNHYQQSGHCYPDLVEKKEGKIIAELRANMWKEDYLLINNNFLKVLKEPLKDGINILFLAKITYDPVSGLRLRILDIDPSYSLGDLEKEKQETIDRLKNEGLFTANQQHKLSLLPQRIAIISVQTSKGYSDFRQVIDHNPWGYQFFLMLFPALLQGDKAVETITRQLAKIQKVIHHFDAVAIIRGGGGDVGLTCYNNYQLSRAVAQFPIPVITGIGHSTNETVTEMVAFKNAITPTELADFLLQKFHNYSVPVQKAQEKLVDKSRRRIREEQAGLINGVKYFKTVTANLLIQKGHELKMQFKTLKQEAISLIGEEKETQEAVVAALKKHSRILVEMQQQLVSQTGRQIRKDVVVLLNRSEVMLDQTRPQIYKGVRALMLTHHRNIEQSRLNLRSGSALFFRDQRFELQNMGKNIQLIDPANVLKRGYSITLVRGKVLKQSADIQPGDIIQTILSDGQLESEVKTVHKTE